MLLKLTDQTLKRSIEKDGLKSLYFIAGNDDFLVEKCVELVCSASGGDRTGIDFCTASDEEIEEPLSTFSFGNRVLVIDNFKASEFKEHKKEIYSEYLPQIPGTLTVVVTLVSEDKRFSLPKSAEQLASMCEEAAMVTCFRKSGSDLLKYVQALATKKGCSISGEAASALVDLCGDNLMQLDNELEKLAASSGYGEITLRSVQTMCPRTTEQSVFDFVREMERGNTGKAVKLLAEIMDIEKEPQKVLAAISSSFVNIARAKAARKAGKDRSTVEEDFGYKKNDKALEIAFNKADRYSDQKMDAIIGLLAETDRKIKTYAGDKNILLEQNMVQLALIVSGRN